jgi:hypothetical protein
MADDYLDLQDCSLISTDSAIIGCGEDGQDRGSWLHGAPIVCPVALEKHLMASNDCGELVDG